jgi:hypothetical protein
MSEPRSPLPESNAAAPVDAEVYFGPFVARPRVNLEVAATFARALDASSESLAKFAATLVAAPCDVAVHLCNKHLFNDLLGHVTQAAPSFDKLVSWDWGTIVRLGPRRLRLAWYADAEHFTTTIPGGTPPEALFVCCWETTRGVEAHVRVQAPYIEWPSAVWRNGGWHRGD